MNPEEPAAFRAVVRGRVQGVGFRDFVAGQAFMRRLDGWVRNLPDETVEVYAQGTRAALQALLLDLRRGPPLAHVDAVNVMWREPQEGIAGFRVRM